ncbi:ATP-binding protein [Rothia mucilaginosa]|uniref:AlbA family DNA-binding domain-containing protein n=1 Tax=Rothia mucilaginosa TaxID=43675 RepID=UPI0028D71813|nr:ATP-binding protein [Rothia mucilaginosa]
MFTPIHRALGLEPGNLTLEIIKKAIEEGLEETADFDMKRVVPNLKEDKSKQEIAKDIAAMANSGGGWIIYGVGEGASDIAGSIHPCEWTATEEQQMLNIAYTKIDPPVVGLEFNKISCGENSDKKLVLMHIPDSADAPHFARAEKNNFSAPRRNGPHTNPMTYRDIERGFRERFQRGVEQEKTLQGYFEQAAEALNPEQGVFLAIAAVPVTPKISATPVSEESMYQYANQKLNPEFLHNFERTIREIGFPLNPEVKKGYRRWLIRTDVNSKVQYRKYFCDNGSMLASYQLGYIRRGSKFFYDKSKKNHCLSKHIELVIADFMSLLRSYSQEHKVYGTYRIRAGLVGSSDAPITIRTISNFDQVLEESYSEPIKRFQPVSTFIDPLVPIEDILPPLCTLALDIVNQGGIQNLQVIAGEES